MTRHAAKPNTKVYYCSCGARHEFSVPSPPDKLAKLREQIVKTTLTRYDFSIMNTGTLRSWMKQAEPVGAICARYELALRESRRGRKNATR